MMSYITVIHIIIECYIAICFTKLLCLHRDKSRNVGKVYCRVCLESFQTTTSFLSEPVDIYNDWVDACEAAN